MRPKYFSEVAVDLEIEEQLVNSFEAQEALLHRSEIASASLLENKLAAENICFIVSKNDAMNLVVCLHTLLFRLG